MLNILRGKRKIVHVLKCARNYSATKQMAETELLCAVITTLLVCPKPP
jgi:hypothetical protein